jgi:hypothetical protein
MRSYPTNSPEAVARLLSLAALADGHLSQVELEALERAGQELPNGLTGAPLRTVLHGLCHDLLSAEHLSWAEACQLAPESLRALFAEIDDPQLRLQALAQALRVARADRVINDAEASLLVNAVTHWGLLDAVDLTTLPQP